MKHFLWFWTLGILIVSGCAKTQENTPQPLVQTRPAPPMVLCTDENPCASTGSCHHTPFEGVRQAVAPQAGGFVDSGYFQKPIQEDLSNSLMDLSGEATWNSILSWGVPVFKIATQGSKNPCRYYAPLSDAPGDLQKKWRSFQHKTVGRGLLGLFTSQTVRNGGGDVSLVDPVILVREDSQRWTLVHESHHFLFARARINVRPYLFDREILQRIEKRRSQILRQKQRFDDNPSNALASKLLESYRKIFELNLDLDRRGPLEEFAIESRLIERWSQNLLVFIHPASDLRNAVAYMASNQSRILGTYRNLRKNARALLEIAKKNRWSSLGTAQNLTRDIRDLIEFTEGKMQSARRLINDRMGPQLLDFPPGGDGRIPFEEILAPKSHYDSEIYDQRDLLMSDLE